MGDKQGSERICHGHERAVVIESLVMDMDVKEEGMLNERRNDLHINYIFKATSLKDKRSQCLGQHSFMCQPRCIN